MNERWKHAHFLCIHSGQDPIDVNMGASLVVQSPGDDDTQTHRLWNGKRVNGASWRGGRKRCGRLWRRKRGGGHSFRGTPAPTDRTIKIVR